MSDGEHGPGFELVVVLTTLPSTEAADRLVSSLLDERLIACANLVTEMMSVYRWEGRVARESEVLVLMKTQRSAVERLFDRITQLHPYELPELVALPVEAVSRAYGQWVRQEMIEVNA